MGKRPPAHTIADEAVVPTNGAEASGLSCSEALAVFHAHVADARQQYNGRELTLFEREPEKVGRLFDLLVAGNYREIAARIAGITDRAIRQWLQKAEAGDPRYEVVAEVVRTAEALAEASAVRNVRAAGRDPRFWASEMTYLERKYPDRWGRRQDDGQSPKVIVQIGVQASDVQIMSSPRAQKSGPPALGPADEG